MVMLCESSFDVQADSALVSDACATALGFGVTPP
jgi:hypothetical protein